jgi:uncharacterized protein YbaA (DUF1428 family)
MSPAGRFGPKKGDRRRPMTYVDGFVIPVKKKQLAAYKKMALWGKRTWMKHGALHYFEGLGDDLEAPPGCGGFKKLAKLRPGETVFFSFIVYRNKAHRNAVNRAVMKEFNKKPMPKMPFSLTRMAMGGFKPLVEGVKGKR